MRDDKDIYDFENNTDDVHWIDWNDDDDCDPNDESAGAEDYYSSRPYTDEQFYVLCTIGPRKTADNAIVTNNF